MVDKLKLRVVGVEGTDGADGDICRYQSVEI